VQKFISITSTGKVLPDLYVVQALLRDGAIKIKTPEEFQENLVCVIEDITHESVCYIQDPVDFNRVLDDDRRKTWLIYEHAENLAEY
jgi:hypothetical protein